MKVKEEYRYQFLRFETIETGKYLVNKNRKSNNLSSGLDVLSNLENTVRSITKEIAVIFDKKLGEVKQVDIKKLNLINKRIVSGKR